MGRICGVSESRLRNSIQGGEKWGHSLAASTNEIWILVAMSVVVAAKGPSSWRSWHVAREKAATRKGEALTNQSTSEKMSLEFFAMIQASFTSPWRPSSVGDSDAMASQS